MDNQIEIIFLQKIELRKDVIVNKQMDKDSRKEKANAWSWVREQLLIETGKEFIVSQLIKKWSNIQTRVKDKIKSGKRTGGGPPENLSEADQLCWKIFGEENPKLTQIPGAFCNTTQLINESSSSSYLITETPKNCGETLKKKRKYVPDVAENEDDEKSIEQLHREVLILQKQKHVLSIKKLKREFVVSTDKSTQTEEYDIYDTDSELEDFYTNCNRV